MVSGKPLKKLRQSLNVSVAEIAAALHVSRQSISQIERGVDPVSAKKLENIKQTIKRIAMRKVQTITKRLQQKG